MDTHSPKAKSSPRRWAGLSSGTSSAFTVPGDVCRPITRKTPVPWARENADTNVKKQHLFIYVSIVYDKRHLCGPKLCLVQANTYLAFHLLVLTT